MSTTILTFLMLLQLNFMLGNLQLRESLLEVMNKMQGIFITDDSPLVDS